MEKHSIIMNNVLTLGHNLLKETNIDGLSRTVKILEQRWISLTELLTRRKLEYVLFVFYHRLIDDINS